MVRLMLLATLLLSLSRAQEIADSLDTGLEDVSEFEWEEAVMDWFVKQQTALHPEDGQGVLRQGVSYQPGAGDWRLYQKLRYRISENQLTLVTEQDPGERSLLDHVAVAWSGKAIEGCLSYTLGAFKPRWGTGFLSHQGVQRYSLTPKSYSRSSTLDFRPHYSTAEKGFFKGVAVSWMRDVWHISSFYSRRTAVGRFVKGSFIEDSDGIHNASSQLTVMAMKDMGLAICHVSPRSKITWSMIRALGGLSLQTEEWIWQADLNPHVQVRISGDLHGNRIVSLYGEQPALRLNITLYAFPKAVALENSSLRMLLDAAGEEGADFRVRMAAASKVNLSYGLLYMKSQNERRLGTIAERMRQQWQLAGRRKGVGFQLSLKEERNVDQISRSWSVGDYVETHRLGVGGKLTMDLNDEVSVDLTFRAAASGSKVSRLVQQRLQLHTDPWDVKLGWSMYDIPTYDLRLSSYDVAPAEGYGFYTAYKPGTRLFALIRYDAGGRIMALKFGKRINRSSLRLEKQLIAQFQLSVVL